MVGFFFEVDFFFNCPAPILLKIFLLLTVQKIKFKTKFKDILKIDKTLNKEGRNLKSGGLTD